MERAGIMALCMAQATVFVVRPELANGVIAGKYFWFYAAMGLIAATALFSQFPNLRKSVQSASSACQTVKIRWTDALIAAYGVLTISISLRVHHSEATTRHILLALVILLYFYFRRFLSVSRSGRYWLMLFFLFTGVVEACWGLRQLYGFSPSQHHLFRLTGSFFNPGPYACYLAVVTPCALHYLLRDCNCLRVKCRLRYWPLYLRWGLSALMLTGAALTLPAAMSRAAWMAVAGGCGIVLYSKIQGFKDSKIYARRSVFKSPWTKCLLPAVLAAGCTGMYYLKKDSADGRALIWKISLHTLAHHPAGVGIGNFSGSYGEAQAAYFASGRGTEQEQRVAGNPEYGFNEYLQIGVEQGVVLLALFLWITGYSLYTGIRRKQTATAASLLALLIAAFASYPFSVLPFLIVMAFLLADVNSKIPKFKDLKIGRMGRLAATLAGACIVACCLYSRWPTYWAYRAWSLAKPLYHANAYEVAIRSYAPLYPWLSDQVDFLFEYGRSLSKTGQYAESNAVLQQAMRMSCDPMLCNVTGKNWQALKAYPQAEACLLKAAQTVPGRLYPWYLLAKLYVETGETEKARETARIVLTKEPKVKSTAVREMREEMRKIIHSEEQN